MYKNVDVVNLYNNAYMQLKDAISFSNVFNIYDSTLEIASSGIYNSSIYTFARVMLNNGTITNELTNSSDINKANVNILSLISYGNSNINVDEISIATLNVIDGSITLKSTSGTTSVYSAYVNITEDNL